LKILLPIIPGTVTLGAISIYKKVHLTVLFSYGFGYKTSIVVCLALLYILGITIMQVTETAFSIAFGHFRNRKGVLVASDRYWKRLATTHLGKELVPQASGEENLEDIYAYMRGLNLLSPEVDEQARRTNTTLIETRNKLSDNMAALSKLAEGETKTSLSEKNKQGQSHLELMEADARGSLQKALAQHEWTQLHLALSWLSEVEDPYVPFDMLLLSMQSASVALLFVLFPGLLHQVPLSLFALAVLACTTHVRWNVHLMNVMSAAYNPSAIATLIQALKGLNGSTAKESTADKKSD
jgi:hypothetical protein